MYISVYMLTISLGPLIYHKSSMVDRVELLPNQKKNKKKEDALYTTCDTKKIIILTFIIAHG